MGDDVEVVEEDPEDFFCYVAYFSAPEFVGSWDAHVEDEVDGSIDGFFCWFA